MNEFSLAKRILKSVKIVRLDDCVQTQSPNQLGRQIRAYAREMARCQFRMPYEFKKVYEKKCKLRKLPKND